MIIGIVAVIACAVVGGILILVFGNDIKEAFERTAAKREAKAGENEMKNQISEWLSTSDFTTSTKEAMNEWQTAELKASEFKQNGAKDYPLIVNLMTWQSDQKLYERQCSRLDAEASTAKINAFNSVSNDPLYQSTLADNRSPASKQKKHGSFSIAIIIAIVILLLLLFLWLNKRAHKPKARPAAPTPPKPAVTQTPQYQIEDHKVKLKADKMNACRSMAKKYGLNADDELVKYNGDVDKLWMSLIQMQPLKDEDGGA